MLGTQCIHQCVKILEKNVDNLNKRIFLESLYSVLDKQVNE